MHSSVPVYWHVKNIKWYVKSIYFRRKKCRENKLQCSHLLCPVFSAIAPRLIFLDICSFNLKLLFIIFEKLKWIFFSTGQKELIQNVKFKCNACVCVSIFNIYHKLHTLEPFIRKCKFMQWPNSQRTFSHCILNVRMRRCVCVRTHAHEPLTYT